MAGVADFSSTVSRWLEGGTSNLRDWLRQTLNAKADREATAGANPTELAAHEPPPAAAPAAAPGRPGAGGCLQHGLDSGSPSESGVKEDSAALAPKILAPGPGPAPASKVPPALGLEDPAVVATEAFLPAVGAREHVSSDVRPAGGAGAGAISLAAAPTNWATPAGAPARSGAPRPGGVDGPQGSSGGAAPAAPEPGAAKEESFLLEAGPPGPEPFSDEDQDLFDLLSPEPGGHLLGAVSEACDTGALDSHKDVVLSPGCGLQPSALLLPDAAGVMAPALQPSHSEPWTAAVAPQGSRAAAAGIHWPPLDPATVALLGLQDLDLTGNDTAAGALSRAAAAPAPAPAWARSAELHMHSPAFPSGEVLRLAQRPQLRRPNSAGSLSVSLTAAGASEAIPAEVLTAQLTCAEDWRLVATLVDAHSARLDVVHVSAALVRLAKLHLRDPAALLAGAGDGGNGPREEVGSTGGDPGRGLAESTADALGGGGAAAGVQAAGTEAVGAHQGWTRDARSAVRTEQSGNGTDVGWSGPDVGPRGERGFGPRAAAEELHPDVCRLVDCLLARLPGMMPQVQHRTVSNMLWALGVLHPLLDPPAQRQLRLRIEQRRVLEAQRHSHQQMTSLHQQHKHLHHHHSRQDEQQQKQKQQRLDELVEEGQPDASDLPAAVGAGIVASGAVLLPPAPPLLIALPRLVAKMRHHWAAVGPRSLALSLWGMARTGQRPNFTWTAEFEAASEPLLPRFTAHELALCLWAFAAMRVRPEATWLAAARGALAAAVAASGSGGVPAPGLSAPVAAGAGGTAADGTLGFQHMATLLWALAALNVRVDEAAGAPLVSALGEQLRREGGRAGPQALSMALWAVTRLGLPLPADFLPAWRAAASGPCLECATARALSYMLSAQVRLRAAPPGLWVDACGAALLARAREGGVSRQALCAAVSGLAALDARPRSEPRVGAGAGGSSAWLWSFLDAAGTPLLPRLSAKELGVLLHSAGRLVHPHSDTSGGPGSDAQGQNHKERQHEGDSGPGGTRGVAERGVYSADDDSAGAGPVADAETAALRAAFLAAADAAAAAALPHATPEDLTGISEGLRALGAPASHRFRRAFERRVVALLRDDLLGPGQAAEVLTRLALHCSTAAAPAGTRAEHRSPSPHTHLDTADDSCRMERERGGSTSPNVAPTAARLSPLAAVRATRRLPPRAFVVSLLAKVVLTEDMWPGFVYDVSRALRAAAGLGYRPSTPAARGAILAAAERVVGRKTSARGVLAVLQALFALRVAPPLEWLSHAAAQAGSVRLRGLSLTEMEALLRLLRALQKPPPEPPPSQPVRQQQHQQDPVSANPAQQQLAVSRGAHRGPALATSPGPQHRVHPDAQGSRQESRRLQEQQQQQQQYPQSRPWRDQPRHQVPVPTMELMAALQPRLAACSIQLLMDLAGTLVAVSGPAEPTDPRGHPAQAAGRSQAQQATMQQVVKRGATRGKVSRHSVVVRDALTPVCSVWVPLDCLLPPGWMTAFEAATAPKLGQLCANGAALVELLACLACLGHSPGRAWVDAWHASTARRMDSLAPQHLCTALRLQRGLVLRPPPDWLRSFAVALAAAEAAAEAATDGRGMPPVEVLAAVAELQRMGYDDTVVLPPAAAAAVEATDAAAATAAASPPALLSGIVASAASRLHRQLLASDPASQLSTLAALQSLADPRVAPLVPQAEGWAVGVLAMAHSVIADQPLRTLLAGLHPPTASAEPWGPTAAAPLDSDTDDSGAVADTEAAPYSGGAAPVAPSPGSLPVALGADPLVLLLASMARWGHAPSSRWLSSVGRHLCARSETQPMPGDWDLPGAAPRRSLARRAAPQPAAAVDVDPHASAAAAAAAARGRRMQQQARYTEAAGAAAAAADTARSVCCLAALGYVPPCDVAAKLQLQLTPALAAAALPAPLCAELCHVWALVRRRPPAAWWRAAEAGSLAPPALAHLPPLALVRLPWSMAQGGHVPSYEWLEAYVALLPSALGALLNGPPAVAGPATADAASAAGQHQHFQQVSLGRSGSGLTAGSGTHTAPAAASPAPGVLADDIANLVWALGVAIQEGDHPAEALLSQSGCGVLQALLTASWTAMGLMGPGHLVSLVEGLAMMRHRLPPLWVAAFAEQVARQLGACSPSDSISFLRCLAFLDARLPAPWLAAVLQHTARGLPALLASSVADRAHDLTWAVPQLDPRGDLARPFLALLAKHQAAAAASGPRTPFSYLGSGALPWGAGAVVAGDEGRSPAPALPEEGDEGSSGAGRGARRRRPKSPQPPRDSAASAEAVGDDKEKSREEGVPADAGRVGSGGGTRRLRGRGGGPGPGASGRRLRLLVSRGA